MPPGGVRIAGPGKTIGRPRNLPKELDLPLTLALRHFLDEVPDRKRVVQLLVEVLVTRALKGDVRALELIWNRIEGKAVSLGGDLSPATGDIGTQADTVDARRLA